VENASTPLRVILMNTVGARLPGEKVTWTEWCVLGLLRWTIPPHYDNEIAQSYLLNSDNSNVEFAVVRPDSLIDEDAVSDYKTTAAPPRTIFSGLPTSRINVAEFMVDLAINDDSFASWKGLSPCIYNVPHSDKQ
jgi:hypothetical protein